MRMGRVEVIENFFMPQLDRYRTLRIYLPPDYNESDKRYEVMYMHDGQNLFDSSISSFGMAWDILGIMDKYYHESGKGIIVVGIDNEEKFRYEEYCPWKNEIMSDRMPHVNMTGRPGGDGFKYIDFIVNNLKPYIDNNFRTLSGRESTAIVGSSMGGLISMVAGIKYQNIFSKIGAFSSAFFFAEDEMKNFIRNSVKEEKMKIYMDVGTNESSNPNIEEFPLYYINSNEEVYKLLREMGFAKDELKFFIEKNGVHNEKEWNRRFPIMLKWLYK